MKTCRQKQMSGFVISDDDLIELDIDPTNVSNAQFEKVVDAATEYLQDSFQSALRNALQEVGII